MIPYILNLCIDFINNTYNYDFFLGIPLYVFGPETHMTSIVGMALGTRPIPQENLVDTATANFALPSGETQPNKRLLDSQKKEQMKTPTSPAVRNAQVVYALLIIVKIVLTNNTNLISILSFKFRKISYSYVILKIKIDKMFTQYLKSTEFIRLISQYMLDNFKKSKDKIDEFKHSYNQHDWKLSLNEYNLSICI